MPYLDPKLTKKVRKELKKRYPDFKFSVRTVDNMCMRVVIREAPYDLLEGTDKTYEQINDFHIDEFYEDEPRKRDLLKEISSIMQCEKKTMFRDGDYGNIPNYYTRLSIGEWNRPFKVTKN